MERSARLPGLDALRGVAVLLVLAGHIAPEIFPGGFLGVSMFFTISGMIITRRALDGTPTGQRFPFAHFWGRRVLRLAPTLLLVLAAVTIAAIVGGATGRVAGPDVITSLLGVFNWRLVATNAGYAVGGDANPLQHIWSLSIEEQFYLGLSGLVFVACTPRWRRGRSVVVIAAALTAILAVSAWSLSRAAPMSRLYYGTDARALEFVAGALLALVIGRWAAGRSHQLIRPAAAVAGVVLGILVLTQPPTTVDTLRWVLPVTTLASVVLVTAAALRWGSGGASPPVSAVTGSLVAVGRWSYAIYLVHWPIAVAVSAAPLWVRAPVVAGVSITAGWLITDRLENPIRARAPSPSLLAAFGLAAAAVAVLSFALPTTTIWERQPDPVMPTAETPAASGVTTSVHGDTDATGVVLVGDSLFLVAALEFRMGDGRVPYRFVTVPMCEPVSVILDGSVDGAMCPEVSEQYQRATSDGFAAVVAVQASVLVPWSDDPADSCPPEVTAYAERLGQAARSIRQLDATPVLIVPATQNAWDGVETCGRQAAFEASDEFDTTIDLLEFECPTCGASPLQGDRLHYQPEAGVAVITEVDRRLNELSTARAGGS